MEEVRREREEFPSNYQVSISIWRKLIRSCNSDGVAHNHSSHNSLISNFLLSGAERSKDNFISYFLWRRERSKETSTPSKASPVYGEDATQEIAETVDFLPFW
jgi:hypothetical protein